MALTSAIQATTGSLGDQGSHKQVKVPVVRGYAGDPGVRGGYTGYTGGTGVRGGCRGTWWYAGVKF